MPARPNYSLYICVTKSAVVAKTTLLPGVKLVHALLIVMMYLARLSHCGADADSAWAKAALRSQQALVVWTGLN